ncbi:unnamed protein product [Adineta steineri]|uniref:Uncharacterized protein n=2 Tax=Adineta steineri TaxID=433720 RepID=A0A819ZLD8_9BILA|nr:unnamed protein product [Adineta steineri]
MIIVPANPNSVQVGMVRIGCLKTQFSSAFPARLNGVISQNEFRESIGNINKNISSRMPKIICLVVFLICLIGGFVLIIAGGTTSRTLRGSQYAIIIGVGAGAMGFASIFFTIGCCVIRLRRTAKMRQSIALESLKYSRRSTGACSWRLHVTTIWVGQYRGRSRYRYIYHIIIDIRHPIASNASAGLHPNPVPARPVSTARPISTARPKSTVQPQDTLAPPPYPGPPAAFCAQCGVPRPNLTANFCSSCGHQFDKY